MIAYKKRVKKSDRQRLGARCKSIKSRAGTPDLEASLTAKPKSGCCNAYITSVEHDDYVEDTCSVCNKQIDYAMMIASWARQEACGVFENFKGIKFFFWGTYSSWDIVQELLAGAAKNDSCRYLGQVAKIINTPGREYDTQDVDMLSFEQHLNFMKRYKSQVANPEIVDLLIEGGRNV